MTATEIRRRILETVSRNGGHLSSSLGAVELSIALAEVFEPQKDRIVWDVGHQAYAWKLLTGRADRFDSLRRIHGLAPFPHPAESPADAAVAGHAGVAISVAAGLAAARELRGTDEQVVAVVGDAAFANGTSLEAVVNLRSLSGKVIVVLNDNETDATHPISDMARRLFEGFGLAVIGPVDGHDVSALKDALTAARGTAGSVLVRVVTRKGMGFPPAEADPIAWHGVRPFNLAAEGKNPPSDGGRTWSEAFGEAILRLASSDSRIVALTAAMRDGTGLSEFSVRCGSRFFDVGIAEGHLVAFAAGLAAGGLRPFVAVYSSFLQRAIDQVMHDVCVPNLPVVFCVDRAGVVGADGVTHQGLYDIPMLKALPNLTICQPKDEPDLESLLKEALDRSGPTVVRYPRGRVPADVESCVDNPTARLAIWTTGDMLEKANAVAAEIGANVVVARYLKPFDRELLARQREKGLGIVSLENGAVVGGFGESIGADLKLGWPDRFVPHGAVCDLEREFGLDVDSMVRACKRLLEALTHG